MFVARAASSPLRAGFAVVAEGRRCSPAAVPRLLPAGAPPVAERGLRVLGCAERVLISCAQASLRHSLWDLPGSEIRPVSPRGQADSSPPSHHGSPCFYDFTNV